MREPGCFRVYNYYLAMEFFTASPLILVFATLFCLNIVSNCAGLKHESIKI